MAYAQPITFSWDVESQDSWGWWLEVSSLLTAVEAAAGWKPGGSGFCYRSCCPALLSYLGSCLSSKPVSFLVLQPLSNSESLCPSCIASNQIPNWQRHEVLWATYSINPLWDLQYYVKPKLFSPKLGESNLQDTVSGGALGGPTEEPGSRASVSKGWFSPAASPPTDARGLDGCPSSFHLSVYRRKTKHMITTILPPPTGISKAFQITTCISKYANSFTGIFHGIKIPL